jgi:excinuclease ABC subunit A
MDRIVIKGARQHNLRNVDIEIPRNRLVVITGVSGSGKSSLAFDTLFAEGQRRYVESLSAYARQFLEQMEKPDVDSIEGLSPAISIEQKTTSKNPRSTVGTVTEIYDYLRLLFASIGVPHCTTCGREIRPQTIQQMVDRIGKMAPGTKFQILAPLARGKKGEYRRQLAQMAKEGFVRARVDGENVDLSGEIPELDKQKKHTIEVVVDRLVAKDPATDESWAGRLADSLETATRIADGLALVAPLSGEEELLSTTYACPDCGTSLAEVTPRLFSFNSPFGACGRCGGLGGTAEVDPEKVVPDPSRSLRGGAIAVWREGSAHWRIRQIEQLARQLKFDLDTPWEKLPVAVRAILLGGSGEREFAFKWEAEKGVYKFESRFEGILPMLARKYREAEKEETREELARFMSLAPCVDCKGRRLKPEALAVTVDDHAIDELTRMCVDEALGFFEGLKLTPREKKISGQILREIRERLGFLANVGIGYLSLDRRAGSLSGGESQRIRLATQIGSKLQGVMYVLDEPSIGLHQKDNRRLLETLVAMRDLGNSVIVVEHDRETIEAADHVIDLGPGAGVHGGELVAEGHWKEIVRVPRSLTGQYLSGKKSIPVPEARRRPDPSRKPAAISVVGARENNLKNLTVRFPLGLFTCVTGVSGSGKSTLVNEILYKGAARKLHDATDPPGAHDRIDGLGALDKVIDVDQSPIGRTPRSNPATYTGVMNAIRDLFAQLPESRMRGYGPGRFSFNVKGGRCEACSGDGQNRIEMHFLPDIYVTCEVCGGKRYNRETLKVAYKGLSIAEVLALPVEQAHEVFRNVPAVANPLRTLVEVGLGYITLGQSATTLSGGEAQRVKLGRELAKRATGRTLYILDEPTTGLHFDDVAKLLRVLHSLTDRGNTIIVIEHNLDVIKTADWIVDLGPEGGRSGGEILAEGTPEEIARHRSSWTGQYLKKELAAKRG